HAEEALKLGAGGLSQSCEPHSRTAFLGGIGRDVVAPLSRRFNIPVLTVEGEPRWTPFFTIARANSMREEYSAFAAAKDRGGDVLITGDWMFNAEIKQAFDLR
ncbi:MAG: hypothetical protein SGPRY_014777, partial [Prymnesium sp.]